MSRTKLPVARASASRKVSLSRCPSGRPVNDVRSTDAAIGLAQIVSTFVSLAIGNDAPLVLQGSSLAAEP